jgi:hypothetical protein
MEKMVAPRGPTAEEFRAVLQERFAAAQRAGCSHVDVNASDLHREVGSHRGRNHRMPSCCQVMRAEMQIGADTVIS